MRTKKGPKIIRKQIRLDVATADLLALLAADLDGNESAAIRRSIRQAAARIPRAVPSQP